jgi:hypothetical protein
LIMVPDALEAISNGRCCHRSLLCAIDHTAEVSRPFCAFVHRK